MTSVRKFAWCSLPAFTGICVVQSCPTLSLPHGLMELTRIFQARILEWVAISSSKGFSRPRDPPGCPSLQADSVESDLMLNLLSRETVTTCIFPPLPERYTNYCFVSLRCSLTVALKGLSIVEGKYKDLRSPDLPLEKPICRSGSNS